MGLSQDADGWTIATPSSDTVIYFVSTSGSGSNDGRDPQGFSLSGATYDHTGGTAEKMLTSSGAFTSYTLTSNSEWLDYIYISAATGGMAIGLYEITSRVSADAITIAETEMTVGGLTADATGISSSSGPKAAVQTTFDLLRDGYPDWLLLKRGDTWDELLGNSTNGRCSTGGRSATERIVINAYGALSTARPKITGKNLPNTPVMYITQGGANLFIGSISLSQDRKNPDDANYEWGAPNTGISLTGVTNQVDQAINILFEDLHVKWASSAFTSGNTTDTTPHAENIEVRRCKLDRNYSFGSHRQGMFVSAIDDISVEECVFYHCGWFGTDRDWADGIHVTFSNATYDHTGGTQERMLTATGAFAGYTWASGDKIWLHNAAGGVANGRYEIAGKIDDDSIYLVDCNGLTADSTADVDSTIPSATLFDHGVYETDFLPENPNLTEDTTVASVSDNGSGYIRVTLAAAQMYSVGDEVAMAGFAGNDDTGDGVYNGHFVVTGVTSATVYDLDREWVVDSSPAAAIIGTSVIANNLTKFTYSDCLFADTSGAGLQLRAGGTIQNCVFLDQGYPMLIGGPSSYYDNHQVWGVDGKVYNNYVEGTQDVDSNSAGQIDLRMRNIRSCTVDSNLFISPATSIVGAETQAINIGGGDRPEHKNRGIVITDNIMWDHASGCPNYNAITKAITTIATETGNWYDDAVNGDDGGVTGWPVTGTNKNIDDLSLVDTTRNIATYSSHIGGSGTKQDFIDGMIGNRRGSWDSDYTTDNAITWIKAGFVQGSSTRRTRGRMRLRAKVS